jgi:hypothetical protein
MPQKTWAIGEEVLATDFNTYVQNQVVPRFATVAARDAAWPAATAGNGAVCTTQDTGTFWVVVANAWVASPPGAGVVQYTNYPSNPGVFSPGTVQIPGWAALPIAARPYPRIVTAVCNVAFAAPTGGTPTYYALTFTWSVVPAFGGNRQFFVARANPGAGQGTCVIGLAAGAAVALTMVVTADVGHTTSLPSTGASYIDIWAVPAAAIGALSP